MDCLPLDSQLPEDGRTQLSLDSIGTTGVKFQEKC